MATYKELMANAPKYVILDIKYAFSSKKSVLSSDWIYQVDPETMFFCKKVNLQSDINCSLYDCFCEALKY